MNSDYRGPYFRTGVDGQGQYWELTSTQSPPFLKPGKVLTRKPADWELRKPQIVLQGAVPDDQYSEPTEVQPVPISGPMEFPNPRESSFVSKEYLKGMLLEIWKESGISPGQTPPDVTKILESVQGRVDEDRSATNALRAAGAIESKLKVNDLGSKKPRSKEVVDLGSKEAKGQEVTEQEVEVNSTKSNHSQGADLPEPIGVNLLTMATRPIRSTRREEKMRSFDFFRKISYEPPKTPKQEEDSDEPKRTTRFNVSEDEPKVKGPRRRLQQSRSRSRGNDSEPLPPTIDEVLAQPEQVFFHNQQGLYPGPTQFPTYTIPQQSGFRMPQHLRRSRANSPRSLQSSREASLHSLMIVKKLPTAGGQFNDRMLPPLLPSDLEPPKRVPKKRFDAWRPLNWTLPQQQQQQNVMREYIRQYQEGNMAQQQLIPGKVKGQPDAGQFRGQTEAGQVKGQPQTARLPSPVPTVAKPKKTSTSSKQFPAYVSPSKIESGYAGPVLDSEANFLRKSIKIKPKF